MDDVTHSTINEVLSEGVGLRKHKGVTLLALFWVDMETGHMSQSYGREALDQAIHEFERSGMDARALEFDAQRSRADDRFKESER